MTMDEMENLFKNMLDLINKSDIDHQDIQCVLAKLLVMVFVVDTPKDEFIKTMNYCYDAELKHQIKMEMH